jgi:hypothetical protein
MPMNLDRPATAHWMETVSEKPSGMSTPFESVANAVRFVMEDLLLPYRESAFIETLDGADRYGIEEIAKIYASDDFKDAQAAE